eukprot:6180506-Pleurochrysis_carterae.AAC.2
MAALSLKVLLSSFCLVICLYMTFQWIVMSATCTLLSGSLWSFRHVSHVCGHAKELRSSPVALSSFNTNLRFCVST